MPPAQQEAALGIPAAGAPPPAVGKAPPPPAPVPAPAVQAFAVDAGEPREGKAGDSGTAEHRAASARPAVDASITFAVLAIIFTVVMLDPIGFLIAALPQLISATAFRCCGDRRLGSRHVRDCLISTCFFACLGFLWYAVVSSLATYGYFVLEWFVGSNVIVVQVSTRSRARGLEG